VPSSAQKQGLPQSWEVGIGPAAPRQPAHESQVLLLLVPSIHDILEPTTGVTFFNSGSKSDPTELFSSIVQVIAS
jgi:hypothetical protein